MTSRPPPARVQLWLTPQEVDLLTCALVRWRWNIAQDKPDKILFYDPGQAMACEFTTRRVDEMRQRLADINQPTDQQTTKGTAP